jgi:hypothetical protein
MAILNRSLDASEQKKTIHATVQIQGVTATATPLWLAPYPCIVHSAKIAALGVSGAPVVHLAQQRFVTGAGFTTVGNVGTLGASVALQEWSLSGVQSMTLGITSVEAYDMLALNCPAQANTGVRNVNVEIVISAIQDIKQHYGV